MGIIALRDEPRQDAIAGIREIISSGLQAIMLTGDNRANAEAVGKILGVKVMTELLPEDSALVKLSRRAMSVIRQNVTVGLGRKAVFLVRLLLTLRAFGSPFSPTLAQPSS